MERIVYRKTFITFLEIHARLRMLNNFRAFHYPTFFLQTSYKSKKKRIFAYWNNFNFTK